MLHIQSVGRLTRHDNIKQAFSATSLFLRSNWGYRAVKVIVSYHSLLSTAHMDSMEETEELLLSILPYPVKEL